MAAVKQNGMVELSNELLPKSMKAFIFVTDGDDSDEKIVDAILYLAKKKGWRKGYLQTVQMDYGFDRVMTLKLSAVFREMMR